MKKLFTTALFLPLTFITPINAETIDQNVTSIESSNRNEKEYNFAGEYPLLEVINLNDMTYRHLNLLMPGDFPILKSIDISSTSGSIKGKLTGHFFALNDIHIHSTSGEIRLDFRGTWEHPCDIQLLATSGAINIKLPTDVNMVVKTRTSSGQVRGHNLKQIESTKTEQTFANYNVQQSKPTLTFVIETTSGDINLN